MPKQNMMITVDVDLLAQANLAGFKGKYASMFEDTLRAAMAIRTHNLNYFDLAKKQKELEKLTKEIEERAVLRTQILSEVKLIEERLSAQKEEKEQQTRLEAAKVNTCVLCLFPIQEKQKREQSFLHDNLQYYHHKECLLSRDKFEDAQGAKISGFKKLQSVMDDIPSFLKTFQSKVAEQ